MFRISKYNVLLWLIAGAIAAVSSPAWSQADSRLKLTTEEQDWLDDHPVIRLGIDPKYQPIEMLEDGQYSGLSREYTDLLAQKLGIQFSAQITNSWSETLQGSKERSIDVLAAVYRTPKRESFLNFTDSYSSLDTGIITSTHYNGPLSLDDLDNKRVAIVAGYYWQDILQKHYPLVKIMTVPDLATGLQEVAFGSSDAMLATIATSTHYLQERGISNLRVAGITPFPAQYRLGVRKDWGILIGIINKALATISNRQHQAIRNRWIQLHDIEPPAQWQSIPLIIGLSIVVFLLLLLSIFWSYSLRNQVKQQTCNLEKELAQHKLTQQQLKQAKVELEIRVEERTEALNETIEALFRSQAELETVNHQLSDMANNDGLTQIANRRHLDLALALALGSTQENHLPLTFILGDIDFFKAFNDHYGHPAGDRCLHEIAQCLSQHAKRSGELAARYGGEEFALLLPGCTGQEAKQICEKILIDIRELNIKHEYSEISRYVSMSLGIVSIVPSEDVQACDLIRWADEALYAAKHSGRNCLRFASPSFPSGQDNGDTLAGSAI